MNGPKPRCKSFRRFLADVNLFQEKTSSLWPRIGSPKSAANPEKRRCKTLERTIRGPRNLRCSDDCCAQRSSSSLKSVRSAIRMQMTGQLMLAAGRLPGGVLLRILRSTLLVRLPPIRVCCGRGGVPVSHFPEVL